MSLRLRLTLTYTLLVALVLAAFGTVLYTTLQSNLESEMDKRLHVRAGQVELAIWPGTSSVTPQDIAEAKLDLSPLADLDAPGVYVEVLDRDGRVVATSDNLHQTPLPTQPQNLAAALAGQRPLTTVRLADGHSVRVLNLPITVDGSSNVVGILQVGQSRAPLEQTMRGLRLLLIVVGGVALALAAGVGWLVALNGLRPLSEISRRAARIAAERDFGSRLGLGTRRRRDEVGDLARTIDDLLATVDETLRRHREFVADTSHELRNPLLAIRTNLELQERLTDPEEQAECRREAQAQVERMSRLVADLLLLARLSSAEVVERREVELEPLLEQAVLEAGRCSAGRRLRLKVVEPTCVLGDADRLRQIAANLLDNAIRHTPPGSEVIVTLDRTERWARLTVRDTGEGIGADELPHIFERFYRAKRHGEGSGLGLAIVKHLAEAHGGTVVVESRTGEGTAFTVLLPHSPRADAPAAEQPPSLVGTV